MESLPSTAKKPSGGEEQVERKEQAGLSHPYTMIKVGVRRESLKEISLQLGLRSAPVPTGINGSDFTGCDTCHMHSDLRFPKAVRPP